MRGSVGNRAVTFALSTLGFPVWSVPTVVMPWHPGHGPSTRLMFDDQVFAAALDDLKSSSWRRAVGAVITGYFASAEQVHAAAELVLTLRREQPGLVYLCDPVIGDRGGLYVAEPIAQAIRDHLLPLASIATPNRYELAWLSGCQVGSNEAIVKASRSLGLLEAVVTSAHAVKAGLIANLHIALDGVQLAEHPELEQVPNGLGDLFSALFLAHNLSGEVGDEALEKATSAVYQATVLAVDAGANELILEGWQDILQAPRMPVAMHRMAADGSPSKQD